MDVKELAGLLAGHDAGVPALLGMASKKSSLKTKEFESDESFELPVRYSKEWNPLGHESLRYPPAPLSTHIVDLMRRGSRSRKREPLVLNL